jgi:chromopyrrolic acid synthase
MSIFDFPRLHFQGFARTHYPTGIGNGLVDLSTNTIYMNGEPFDVGNPPSDYHKYLYELGPRFNAEGHWDDQGPFSKAMGWDFGGNGHFAIEAKVLSTQSFPGQVDQTDSVVGRAVDMWGHFNDYLGTTVNRCRIFDCDPASNWTNAIMIGQLTFGRDGISSEVPNMFSAPVEGLQPARWQNFKQILELPDHCLNAEFQRSSIYQFTVSKSAKDFQWGPEISPTVSLMREAMSRDDVLGLVVQFSLNNMSAPEQPDSPVFWDLHGTIGLWCTGELSTYPHGRLLTPRVIPRKSDQSNLLSNLTVQVSSDFVSLNMLTAVPSVGRSAKAKNAPTHKVGPKLDLGDLELRTVQTQRLIAKIPKKLYQREIYQLTSGVVDVPLELFSDDLCAEISGHGLCITRISSDGQLQILLQEEEINLQVSQSCIFVEFPNWSQNEDYATEIEINSFVRGQLQSVQDIHLFQFYNPRGLPQLLYEFERDSNNSNQSFHFPQSSALDIVHFKSGALEEGGDFANDCKISTNEEGQGFVTLRGVHPGTTRVLLSLYPNDIPVDPVDPDEALLSYDNDDNLNFWSSVGYISIRVLTNDWHLLTVEDSEINFDFIYKHIMAFYETSFSFMKMEVFSLADRCKVNNYSRLIWQMCDPRNRNKTYYMPPTRDLSLPQAMLLRRFVDQQQRIGYIPAPEPVPKRPQCKLQTRDELVKALQHAAELEVAVMLQYLYAAFSIPNYVTAQEYVRQGLWTPEQLKMACGDGEEVHDYGMRGTLLKIAHEEMLHFLMVNNILMAVGEAFYPAMPNFNKLNQYFPIEIDFALESFSALSLQRFMRFELPDFLEEDLAGKTIVNEPSADRLHGYGSLSELYQQIREAFNEIPDLIVVKKGRVGGEHHLFLREDFNVSHPDYQLQVDDVESAIFAIDIIVEHGEGCSPESSSFDRSHFQQFRRMSEFLTKEQATDQGPNARKLPWTPSYPVLRNPTLNHHNYQANVVTVPETRAVMKIFDECYFLMMQIIVQHFGWMPNGSLRRSKLMNASIDVMAGMLRPLGELLMTMPSGKRGKTAGPSFEVTSLPKYIPTPEVAYQTISQRFGRIGSQARSCPAIDSTVCGMIDFFENFFIELTKDPNYISR